MPPPLKFLPKDLAGYRDLEPEDVGIQLVKAHLSGGRSRGLGFGDLENELPHYLPGERREILEHLAEGWSWAEANGLLARDSSHGIDRQFVTRLGRLVAKSAVDERAFREGRRLPRDLLHPSVSAKSWGPFLKGDYDTAVFTAFKEVEVSVREAGGFGAEHYGVDLMRAAFKPAEGPLADKSAPKAEQEALSHLFAGAIGSYKNPNSHRHIKLSPQEAAEMVVLASHLLGIVEARASAEGAKGQ